MTDTAFEGASTGFRLAHKGLSRGDADTYAARELEFLWSRAHHLCRNNPAAVTAKNRLIAHWVGSGIGVHWKNKKVQLAWEEFIADPNLDGFGTFHNTQAVWAGSLFETGEAITRQVVKKSLNKIPLKLQTLASEQLDPKYYAPGIRNGIKFNKAGRPEYYHFWKQHPGSRGIAAPNKRIAVPADRVLHLLDRGTPGQWRGLPKLAPAILTLYEMDELTDAALVRQKAAQAVGWVIKKSGSGGLPLVGAMGETNTEMSDDENDVGSRIQKVLPGGVHYLEDDEDFTFASIDDIGNNFVTLLEHNWRMIASCLDVTYEQLTGDLSKTNLASIRAGNIEFKKRISLCQQLIFVNLGLIPLTKLFKEMSGVYINREAANAECSFSFPTTTEVDRLKDVQADAMELQLGLATLREKLQERGVLNIEDHIKQLIEEQGYEVVLTSNPKHGLKDNVTEGSAAEPVTKETDTKPKGQVNE